MMYQIGTDDQKYQRIFGFSSFVLDATYYDDDGEVISQRSAQVGIKDPAKVVTIDFDLGAQTTGVTIEPLSSVTVTDYYPASGTTSTFSIENLEQITISIGADGFGHAIA